MKLALLLALGLVISQNSFAYVCSVHSSDGSLKKLPYTLSIDNQTTSGEFAVQSTNGLPGLKYKSYYFMLIGQVSAQAIDVNLASTGLLGRWDDDSEEESTWTDVSFQPSGYINAKKMTSAKLGQGIIGEASFGFINDGEKVIVKCVDTSQNSGNDCMFCN